MTSSRTLPEASTRERAATSVTTGLANILAKAGLLNGDLDDHLIRASMVMIFFGQQKGFEYEPLGILGALGSCATFPGTVTIIQFMPYGWAPSAGGFPAMAGNVPFLMKDVALLAVSMTC